MELSKLEGWVDPRDEEELVAEQERVNQFLAKVTTEIDALPKARRARWNHTPVHLLGDRSPHRALLRREAHLAGRRSIRLNRPMRRESRGSSRMRRARRVARTRGSRGDPDPPGEHHPHVVVDRRRREVAA